MKMIKVKGLLVGKYPVKQRQYEKMMEYNPSHFHGKKLPVENVTWYDAVMFCNKLSEAEGVESYYTLTDIVYGGTEGASNITSATVVEATTGIAIYGYRLPTKKEWLSFADDGYKYSGSDTIGEVAWYWGNSQNKTHKVGEKNPNKFGLYDITGNIWEWCYSHDNVKPLRGGSWYDDESNCVLSNRIGNGAGRSDSDYGFRVIRKTKKEETNEKN